MFNYKTIKKIKSEMKIENHPLRKLIEQEPINLSVGYGKSISWTD